MILMVDWREMLSAAPGQNVVSGTLRGTSWCRTAPSWGSQCLKLSWSHVDFPCLGCLKEFRVVFVSWTTVKSESGSK